MLAPLVEPKDDRSMFESPCPALGAVPPSRLIAVRRVAADGVVAAGVAMSDQHRIPAVGREPAIGLVGDLTCGITVPFCSRKVSQLGSTSERSTERRLPTSMFVETCTDIDIVWLVRGTLST
jgi:hypothetical protein